MQYQSSCAPKLARKCGIEHWFSCGADGRAAGGPVYGHVITNFLGWVDLLTHGAPQARFARQSSATNYLLRTRSNSSLLVHLTYKTEFLVFPLVQPAGTTSEHNTLFTRSQNLQTPVADFLLYLSQTCSGFSLPVGGCTLVQFGFARPFLERYYVTH